ncbi:putative membrane protein YpjA [Sinobaca qinghaiensis]|uniref:Putative membrane protein YpjA n=1 Tax=Sinobaca qinghaiensis TaxID=342944 RepID=A0A419V2S4_9BACL|nr:DUF1405 domain-containing protein [Sinobaca qinghaiensis]RKD72837.1 putative membrane protein YpjA [Sinobaca qinghaiensis]
MIVLRWMTYSPVLWILLTINVFGTLYGYYWYAYQLASTPPVFLLFVPDSPTASLFFCLVLFSFIIKKQNGLIEALAAVTLIKYGIWAVVMNTAAGLAGGALEWQHYMLIASHAGMAIQAFLYMPFYRIKAWHLAAAAVWTVHNDIIDYVYEMYPWLSPALSSYVSHIGYFTFWLGIISVGAVYLLGVRRKRKTLSLM